MTQLVWKTQFEFNIPMIDAQHKSFMKYLNLCLDNRTLAEGAVNDLKDYAEFHFKNEENLMLKLGYHSLEPHVDEHIKFSDQLAYLEDAFKTNNSTAINKTIEFMHFWFINHILVIDKECANFIFANLSETEISNLASYIEEKP